MNTDSIISQIQQEFADRDAQIASEKSDQAELLNAIAALNTQLDAAKEAGTNATTVDDALIAQLKQDVTDAQAKVADRDALATQLSAVTSERDLLAAQVAAGSAPYEMQLTDLQTQLQVTRQQLSDLNASIDRAQGQPSAQ